MEPTSSVTTNSASGAAASWYVRTVIFYVVLAMITLVWFIPSFTIGLLLPLKARNFFVMGIPCRAAIFALRWICGVRYEVEGKENIPHDGRGYVLLSKHQSTWETFFLPTLITPHVQVVKKELFYLPLFGWMLNLIHPIFIDRSKRTGAMKQVLTQGADRLESGIHVLVFPEGTRVPPGKRKTFSKGGAMLASKSGADVIAIAHNSGEYWPNNSWVKRPGTIHVVISPAFPSADLTSAQLAEQTENWINEQTDRISTVSFNGELVQNDTSGKRF
ncbi:MAG: 1-acyl-sn-glycerol-3-phosphate acyltransferase [Oleibacter sp.]|nr:1-acyl-sn-glycerol-3-phosphate acyltransferase [Thalassolituus sp.]|tara:strand:- start:1045 stop:1866 length:822 start_codon:yes stop_codon:yes gene_type:complete